MFRIVFFPSHPCLCPPQKMKDCKHVDYKPPDKIEQSCTSLLKSMLSVNPDMRLSMEVGGCFTTKLLIIWFVLKLFFKLTKSWCGVLLRFFTWIKMGCLTHSISAGTCTEFCFSGHYLPSMDYRGF